MRLLRYTDESGVKIGVVKNDGVIDLSKRYPISAKCFQPPCPVRQGATSQPMDSSR